VDDSLWTPSSASLAFRGENAQDESFAGVRVEYFRPLGLAWQADLSGEALVQVSDVEGWIGSGTARLSWMVADRWEASGSGAYDREFVQDHAKGVLNDEWSWNYGVSGTWYIEDRLQLTLSAQETQAHSGASPFGGNQYRSGGVTLALTYRILGGFGAPGLIPHESL
jgi:hypothetical protein